MNQISNADKQARYRKKEQLKRHAENIYRNWELSIKRYRSNRVPEEVRDCLEKAIELPSGWTEEDYTYALIKLEQYKADLDFAVDQIANDINGPFPDEEFLNTADPVRYVADHKASIEKARALSSHLISALRLSNCSDSQQAAALMEALRFVGRSLLSNREVHCSQATAMCLASIDSHYDRPEWFAKELAKSITQQVDRKLALEIGHHLIKQGTN